MIESEGVKEQRKEEKESENEWKGRL